MVLCHALHYCILQRRTLVEMIIWFKTFKKKIKALVLRKMYPFWLPCKRFIWKESFTQKWTHRHRADVWFAKPRGSNGSEFGVSRGKLWHRERINNRALCIAQWVYVLRLSVLFDSFATPRTVAHQAPLSMGFPRQEYWSGLSFPTPGDLPDPVIKPISCIGRRFFTPEPPGKHL